MTNRDIVYDKFHFRHDPKWNIRFGPPAPEGGGLRLCLACVIEMMDDEDITVRRGRIYFYEIWPHGVVLIVCYGSVFSCTLFRINQEILSKTALSC